MYCYIAVLSDKFPLLMIYAESCWCYIYVFTCNVSGTGVVTSVPSDAPDDFAALRDLKKKQVWFLFVLT